MGRWFLHLMVAALAASTLGCPPRVKEGKTPILQPIPPPGTPTNAPAGGPVTGPQDPLAVALPLPPTGHNSEAQLALERGKLQDATQQAIFEQGFRLGFTTNKSARDPGRVRELLAPLTAAKFAPAWRIVGYSYVDDGFQVGEAVRCYREAIAADETYGPAHYALAFMLGQSDPATGKQHFERAMALGVEDQRDLRSKFFR